MFSPWGPGNYPNCGRRELTLERGCRLKQPSLPLLAANGIVVSLPYDSLFSVVTMSIEREVPTAGAATSNSVAVLWPDGCTQIYATLGELIA
jgi:hypothetical protein